MTDIAKNTTKIESKGEQKHIFTRRKSTYERVMDSDVDGCARIFQKYDKKGRGYIN